MRFGHLLMAILALAFPGQSALAEPMLLASYDHHVEGGSAPLAIPEVEFILQLGVDTWETHPTLRALGGGIFWGDGDQGRIEFTSSPLIQTVDDLARVATNGIADQFRVWDLNRHGSGGGSAPISESKVFGVAPDLIGHDLTRIDLVVRSVEFWPWTPPSGLEGYRYSADLTWQFFGAATPEPSASLYAWFSVLYACGLRKRGMKISG